MKLRATFALLTVFILSAVFTQAQPRAYLPSIFEDTVTVLDVSTNSVIDVIDVGDRAVSAAVTPDGTKVYAAVNPSSDPGTVEVIQASTNTVIATINVGGSPSDIAITPDGTRAYVTNFDGFVSVIETSGDTILTTIPIPGANPFAGFVSISPNGLYAYVLTTNISERLITINTTSNAVIPGFTRSNLDSGVGMDITPDGTILYIAFRKPAIAATDDVQQVDLNTVTGEPTLGTVYPLVFSGGSPPANCELRPQSLAVHPTTGLPWIVTIPSPFLSFDVCPPSSPFHADLVIIDPDAMTPTLLFSGLPSPPWPFQRLGFTRDGGDVVLIEGSRVNTSPANFPLMLGPQISVDASFPQSPYFIGPPMSQLSVTKTGNGDGNITSMNPAGMNCDSSMAEICDIAVPTGMTVTLTATADPSSIFNGWGGDCSGASNTTMITVSADSECTADFEIQQFNVDISINPPGGGSVTSSPSGIDCPGDCSELFDINTFINLNESPDPDFNFASWTGDPDCSDGDIDDLMEDTSCTANFNIKRFVVTVVIAGDGVGSVSSMPAGITCPGDCTEIYDIHTMVNLNETVNPDSDFLGWSGPADCADGIIQDLTEDITCTATFNLKRFTLNITKSGAGAGVVTSNPTGIDCGADCDEVFIIDTVVTLSAVADPVSIFTGFSGDPDCEDGAVIMTSDITCNANFDFLPLILNPIFPGIASSINEISADVASPNGPVAFVWGLMAGATTVGGQTCNGITLGIKNPKLLSLVNANMDQTATYAFFIPLIGDFELPILTQAVDIDTCRVSEVEVNIIRKQ